ncbi:MAG: hypothetical protein ACI965_001111 [Paraglaciecola sp.]|jgi:hypothetical protein
MTSLAMGTVCLVMMASICVANALNAKLFYSTGLMSTKFLKAYSEGE